MVRMGEFSGSGVLRGLPMDRIERIRQDVTGSPVHLCPERAYLVTEFFKKLDDPTEPMVVRKARVLHHLLTNKAVRIYPGELIAGNAGTQRRSCVLQPELSSAFMSEELLWIDRRRTTPMKISWRDRLRLATEVIPYWLKRCTTSSTRQGVSATSCRTTRRCSSWAPRGFAQP
jgi:formate C-acetyltransferase